MSKFVILLGGPVTPTVRLMRQIAGARVIAADSGMQHATALQLAPELWVGDFDSTPQALADQFHNVPRQTHPAEKDASDGELAISEAFRRGATSLILLGGMGGQLDHVLAHAAFVVTLAERGVQVMMTSGHEEAYGLADEFDLPDAELGHRLSVMPFTNLIGLSMSGVKYPLENAKIKLGTAQTLANVVAGPVKITLTAGKALVVYYPHG
jgi:thiamine pyrophosphokinase